MTDLLTVKEAAEHARVSASLVRGWVRDGRLAHYRVGAAGHRGKIAIARADLDALLASFKVGANGPEPVKAPAPRRTRSTFRHLDFS